MYAIRSYYEEMATEWDERIPTLDERPASDEAPDRPEESTAVELCGLEEAPGEAARAAVLLGCGRGRFPAPVGPEPLLRAQNLVGYRNYADDLAKAFVERAAENGMDT